MLTQFDCYLCEKEKLISIYGKNRDGRLEVGDELVNVNGANMRGLTTEQVSEGSILPNMIFVNSLTQARIRKNESLPKKMRTSLHDWSYRQFRHPTTRVLLKFELSLPKIPTLPKATQMSLKLH